MFGNTTVETTNFVGNKFIYYCSVLVHLFLIKNMDL